MTDLGTRVDAESLLDILLESMPHGVVITNADDNTALVNAAAASLLECPVGQISADTFTAAMKSLHRRLSGSSQVRVDGQDLINASGATRINGVWDVLRPIRRIVLVSTLPLQSPAVRGRLWTFHDVSELHHVEAEQAQLLRQLDRERGRLDELLTHAPAMILIVRGPEYVVEYANDAVIQFTGGRQVAGLRLFADAAPGLAGSDVHKAYDAAFQSGMPWNGSAVRVAMADSARPRPSGEGGEGDYFYNVSLQPLRDADGRMSGLFVHAVDVTAQVKAVEQLRQSQRLETMGRLAGGVAHDFNNLLSIIKSCTEMILAELPASSRAYARAADVSNAARRAASLTRQLLTFGRRHVLQQQLVSLDDVVRGIERLVRQLMGEQVTVDFALEAGDAKLVADPSHLEQVLLNLAANARDAMPDGGALSIRTRIAQASDTPQGAPHGAPHGAPRLRGPHLRIEVQDTGEGMDTSTVAQAFEPFFTTKPPEKGTGLGLSTVRSIVLETGGQLWIDSEPGRGTTVVITLPMADGSPASVAKRPVAAPPTTRSTLLLVEDDQVTALLAQRILTEDGYRVLLARNGVDGLRMWQNHLAQFAESGLSSDWRISVVIADLAMPDLNGRDMVRQMRAMMPSVRVLFTSGDSRAMLEADDLRGPTVFLPKPFTPEQLLREVAALLPGD